MADKVIIFSRIFKIGFEMIRVNFRHPRGVVRKSPVSDTLILLNFWSNFGGPWWKVAVPICLLVHMSGTNWSPQYPHVVVIS